MIVRFKSDFKPWLAASQDDFRPVLRGVFLDPDGYLVGTDTKVLAVVPCEIEDKPEDFNGTIIPADFLRAVAQFKPTKTSEFVLNVELKGERGTVAAYTRLGNLSTELIANDKFPNWRKVIPALSADATSTALARFNPELITRLAQALGTRRDLRMVHHPEVSGPCVAMGAEGSFGLVMPMAWGDSDRTATAKLCEMLAAMRPASPCVLPKKRAKAA